MRFELEIRNIQGSKRIILSFLSIYPRSFGRVQAIIDTGSPITILSAADAQRLNIPFKNFQSSSPIKGFGRGGTPTLSIDNFQISLRSFDNKRKSLEFPITVVDVPILRKFGEDVLNQAFTIPTIIGLDFLEANKFKLFIDVNNNTAHLEE